MSTATSAIRAREIKEINQLYWLCLREMAISNPAEAALRFGVTREVADQVVECSLSELCTLAGAAVMQFRPKKIDVSFFDKADDPDARLRQLARGLS